MAKKKQTEEIIQKINDYALEEIMGDRFGRYAKEIIQDRAITDVRDGLKPVQRRILYGMYKSKNTYDNKIESLLEQSEKSWENTIHMVIYLYMMQWYV